MAPLSNLRNRIAPAERERGAVLVLTALVMMLLLMIAAFATDLGAWYRQGQEQQRAADVGALNGVQAYDTAVKAYFADQGKQSWDDLTDAQAQAAEDIGLQAAAQTIIGVLESSGLTFSDLGSGVLATDPTDVFQTSIWTVVADDGTEIIITRSFQQTGLDSSNNPTYSRAIDVLVVAPVEQYFSNIIRDAPEISRSATSVVSNCGAICSTPIVLNPPFRGFDAAGNGDGWVPLLRGDTEIWAVNHHSNNKGKVIGDVICMDRVTETFCDFTYSGETAKGRIPLTGFRTHTRASDIIYDDNIYFTTGSQFGDGKSGLACFDMAARDWCGSGKFLPLFDFDGRDSDTNAVGPVEYGGKLYIIAQHGELVCVDPGTMTECGSNMVAASSVANMPDENSNGKTNNLELVGSELFMSFALTDGSTALDCWDFTKNGGAGGSCWGSASVTYETKGNTSVRRFTFLQLDANGNALAICVATSTTGEHECAATGDGALYGLGTDFVALINKVEDGWIGDTYGATRGGVSRTFFGGGASNKSVCWDWKTSSACNGTGVFDHDPVAVEPYAYVHVTDDCLLGLGDEAQFFTLDVGTLEPCVGSSVTTEVMPCRCDDGSSRYGILDLPQSLKDQLDTASAVVIGEDADGNYLEISGNLLDLPMDLSPFNGFDGPLELTITVDSKVVNGVVVWDEVAEFDLELTVQPTLTN